LSTALCPGKKKGRPMTPEAECFGNLEETKEEGGDLRQVVSVSICGGGALRAGKICWPRKTKPSPRTWGTPLQFHAKREDALKRGSKRLRDSPKKHVD